MSTEVEQQEFGLPSDKPGPELTQHRVIDAWVS